MLLLCSAASYAEDYKVKSGDNLSTIAAYFKHTRISTEEMMNAIYFNNPSAFVNESINALKLGVTLHIPTNNTEIQELAATSSTNSRNEIRGEIADIKKEILAVIKNMATSRNVLEKNVSNL